MKLIDSTFQQTQGKAAKINWKVLILVGCVTLLVILGVMAWNWLYPFFSHLRAPEAPIEEVIIRGYGSVPPSLLEDVKNVVEEKIGVRARVDYFNPSFSGQSIYYNPQRDQYDADKIWNYESAFAIGRLNKRLIMVVDVDMYTEIQLERPYVLTRSSPNVKVILISTYRLQKLSDTSDEQASPELITVRIQKLALQTLGVSVFLEGFLSYGKTEDISCVMYRGRILSELDKQGDDFCEENKGKLKDYFMINGVGQPVE